MSDSPPPVDDDKGMQNVDIDLDNSAENDFVDSNKKPPLNDDLFFSTISDPDLSDESKKQSEANKEEDMDEIFKSNKPVSSREIKLDEDDNLFGSDSSSNNLKHEANSKSNLSDVAPNVQSTATDRSNSFKTSEPTEKKTLKEHTFQSLLSNDHLSDENDEDRDKVLEITLSDPTKVGDGMGSYMTYKLTVKTNMPFFKKTEFSTNRRFSDFLNLYEKLKEKHLPAGRVLPPAPEKDMIGMAKVKISKEDTTPNDFIEKRRAALQRFLNRLAKHKTFRYDPDFRDFLEIDQDLPKATNTSSLSGAGMLKMIKNVTDSVSKISVKMDETDQWFEEKTRQVDNLYIQFKKLHSTVEMLYGWRKDLASATKDFSKSISILANSEEQLNLSRALSLLGDIYEKIDQIYVDQTNADYFNFCELVKDYVCLFDNIKEVLYQRVKTYSNWQKAEEALKAKREAKTKLEAANKQDKIPAVAAEIKDLESKVEKLKNEFDQISKTIKEEMRVFDFNRAKDFRVELTKYLQTLLQNQEVLVKIWENYLPQVKSI